MKTINAMDDVIVVLEFLLSQKTATGNVAEAMERLRNRVKSGIPVDVKLPPTGD